ncbi:prephenate dehydrogenase [Virgibacillus salarius]|uniref:prephenate dehydrogenase n=1 Tax=Virgibacillus salarius TaxID=447199 RepID=UPI002490A295|nr:prephenate dehydrogenase [Virgibacillus salarius]WBX79270.1 prephenate dehydrogenase [Virgibacillus salarius]
MKRRIVIAGLGLIGASIAKGLARVADHHIIGYDINTAILEYAKQNNIVHEVITEFPMDAINADYIILAAPISETIALLQKLDEVPFPNRVIISDVSSVKQSVIHTANQLKNKKIVFIGGHPMAGSHKKGIEAAKSHLFENAIYVLTPTVNSTNNEVEELKEILLPTKSKFITLNAEEHDEMTGVVSHFPHLIASSLVHQAEHWAKTHSYLPNLAAGGFRDITRIASSNPTLWQDIFYHNRKKMSQLLEEWITEMQFLKNLVDTSSKKEMIQYLDRAKNYRDGLGTSDKGIIPSYYDLYVDIRDQTGALAEVTQLLADESISINNIQILEIREGIMGALRLSFATQQLQKSSEHILKQQGYETMIEK